MSPDFDLSSLKTFLFHGVSRKVDYVKTDEVKPGVRCAVYRFRFDETMDLGLISIDKNNYTYWQEVMDGIETWECEMAGRGTLSVYADEYSIEPRIYETSQTGSGRMEILINKGNIMRWDTHKNSNLLVAEVCHKPYRDGRFKDLPNNWRNLL